MQKYAKIINNVVDNISFKQLEGYIEVPNTVFGGMIKNEDNTFSNPLKDISELKSEKLQVLKTNFQIKQQAPINTGLNFQVNGGLESLKSFEIGLKNDFLNVMDIENISHTVTALQMKEDIIENIEQQGLINLQWKWDKRDEINACQTIEELDLIEI